MNRKAIMKFRIKTHKEKERECLATNWQDVLSEVHGKVENNNVIGRLFRL